MYARNARSIVPLIPLYKHGRLLSQIKFLRDAVSALFKRENVIESHCGSKLSGWKSFHDTDGKMMKLTPLSGLRLAEGNQKKNTEISDTSITTTRSNEKMGEVARQSILPAELLNNVEQLVKTQVGKGEFSNADHGRLMNENAFTQSDKPKEPTSEVLTSHHNDNLWEENEDSTAKIKEDDTDSDVCDISVLFSEKFDKTCKKSTKKAAQKSGKKRKKDLVEEEEDEECDVAEIKKKKPKKIMPNYFIAVQVTNSKIHEGLLTVQRSIQEQMPSLTAAMIPLPTLHLTLLVMHLANEEEVQKAKTALKHCGRRLSSMRERPVILGVSGIGHFGNNVVFAKVVQNSNLDLLNKVANMVDETFRKSEVHLAGEKGFKPHITIMKLSRSPKLRKKGIKKIDSKYYSHYADTTFGNQTIESLQLCSMMAAKDKDGYYQVVYSVPWGKAIEDGGPEHVFTAEMEKEVVWDFVAGPAPDPVEPTEEQRKRLLDSLSAKMGLNEDRSKSKLKTGRTLTKVPQRKF